jgi:hypothetical protein
MAIIRITRKQIQQANEAREAALIEDKEFRRHDEQLRRFVRAAAAAKVAAAEKKEQPS